jgi:ribose-phosphate pyrophosphokinase
MERFVVLGGTANPALAEAIAGHLRVPVGRSRIERFPDGETAIEIEESVRDRHVFIVQPTSPPVNEHLMELAALADGCRRAAAERVTAVVPYFGYARADRRKGRRVPIMARAAADLLEACGIDHLVTLDLHSPQVEGFFRVPVENLTAVPVLVQALRERVRAETVIVSPDFGAVERASTFADRLGCAVAVLPKRRLSGSAVEVGMPIGEVAGRHCLILDDMISTGGTILKGLDALQKAGALPGVTVAATHGVFAEGALERLRAAGVADLLVTDSVAPAPREEGVHRVSIAPVLGAALERIATGESLGDLF